MTRLNSLAILSSLLIAAGCAGEDSVLFVTTTQIGIDADTKPPNISIGYDRYEGYVGPVYQSGAIPPVFARLESNLKIFSPEIRQVYATGDAARLVTSPNPSISNKALTGNKKVAFVGTGTNIGLKVSFAGNAPESFSFGFKRKEISFIPVIRSTEDGAKHEDQYGSVLAAIDLNVNTPTLTDTRLGVSQFFATGIAAEQLASTNEKIRGELKKIAAQAVALKTAKFTKDQASNRLIETINEDPEFRKDLTKWIEEQDLGISTTLLIYGDKYADERNRAVENLLSPE
jgi:hypothetical protein